MAWEPSSALQNRCSTPELTRQFEGLDTSVYRNCYRIATEGSVRRSAAAARCFNGAPGSATGRVFYEIVI